MISFGGFRYGELGSGGVDGVAFLPAFLLLVVPITSSSIDNLLGGADRARLRFAGDSLPFPFYLGSPPAFGCLVTWKEKFLTRQSGD